MKAERKKLKIPDIKILTVFLIFFSLNSILADSLAGCGEARVVGCSFTFNGSSAPTILSLTPPVNNIGAGQLKGNVVVSIIGKANTVNSQAYEVSISENGTPRSGRYRLTQAQMNSMSQNKAALDSSAAFAQLNKTLQAQKQCAALGQGVSPVLNQGESQPQLAPQQAVDQLNNQRYAHRTTDDPEERRRYQEERNETRRRVEQGDAPIAGGRTIAVGSGTGLINMREDDPNGNNPTPECDILRVTPEEASEEDGFTNENLTSCISAIQRKILDGFNSPPHPKNRNEIFRNLFELPNEEQEFAAALFTLAGETSKSSKPMDRLMIIKVLANRRNNANEVENQIAECKENHSDSSEQTQCIAGAQKDAKFNLLDLALDRRQFSMYNDCPDASTMSAAQARTSCSENGNIAANWYNNLGNTNYDFSSELEVFMNYENIDTITMHGAGPNADVEKIYHYVTPASYPNTGWAQKQDHKIMLSATTSDGEELKQTTAHYFFYNVDTLGSPNGDGIVKTPSHEFRRF